METKVDIDRKEAHPHSEQIVFDQNLLHFRHELGEGLHGHTFWSWLMLLRLAERVAVPHPVFAIAAVQPARFG